ncbi:hypothetical protein Tcan_06635 [Toxocara canis]|uniref:Uncharacterized protein n=1 Tax=Toxocara canis TaxID=6265 RepID=A0A0B2UY71_TOXCA|nr:hypothetical protein Tcan_06635 [Toxocara canis]
MVQGFLHREQQNNVSSVGKLAHSTAFQAIDETFRAIGLSSVDDLSSKRKDAQTSVRQAFTKAISSGSVSFVGKRGERPPPPPTYLSIMVQGFLHREQQNNVSSVGKLAHSTAFQAIDETFRAIGLSSVDDLSSKRKDAQTSVRQAFTKAISSGSVSFVGKRGERPPPPPTYLSIMVQGFLHREQQNNVSSVGKLAHSTAFQAIDETFRAIGLSSVDDLSSKRKDAQTSVRQAFTKAISSGSVSFVGKRGERPPPPPTYLSIMVQGFLHREQQNNVSSVGKLAHSTAFQAIDETFRAIGLSSVDDLSSKRKDAQTSVRQAFTKAISSGSVSFVGKRGERPPPPPTYLSIMVQGFLHREQQNNVSSVGKLAHSTAFQAIDETFRAIGLSSVDDLSSKRKDAQTSVRQAFTKAISSGSVSFVGKRGERPPPPPTYLSIMVQGFLHREQQNNVSSVGKLAHSTAFQAIDETFRAIGLSSVDDLSSKRKDAQTSVRQAFTKAISSGSVSFVGKRGERPPPPPTYLSIMVQGFLHREQQNNVSSVGKLAHSTAFQAIDETFRAIGLSSVDDLSSKRKDAQTSVRQAFTKAISSGSVSFVGKRGERPPPPPTYLSIMVQGFLHREQQNNVSSVGKLAHSTAFQAIDETFRAIGLSSVDDLSSKRKDAQTSVRQAFTKAISSGSVSFVGKRGERPPPPPTYLSIMVQGFLHREQQNNVSSVGKLAHSTAFQAIDETFRAIGLSSVDDLSSKRKDAQTSVRQAFTKAISSGSVSFVGKRGERPPPPPTYLSIMVQGFLHREQQNNVSSVGKLAHSTAFQAIDETFRAIGLSSVDDLSSKRKDAQTSVRQAFTKAISSGSVSFVGKRGERPPPPPTYLSIMVQGFLHREQQNNVSSVGKLAHSTAFQAIDETFRAIGLSSVDDLSSKRKDAQTSVRQAFTKAISSGSVSFVGKRGERPPPPPTYLSIMVQGFLHREQQNNVSSVGKLAHSTAFQAIDETFRAIGLSSVDDLSSKRKDAQTSVRQAFTKAISSGSVSFVGKRGERPPPPPTYLSIMVQGFLHREQQNNVSSVGKLAHSTAFQAIDETFRAIGLSSVDDLSSKRKDAQTSVRQAFTKAISSGSVSFVGKRGERPPPPPTYLSIMVQGFLHREQQNNVSSVGKLAHSTAFQAIDETFRAIGLSSVFFF